MKRFFSVFIFVFFISQKIFSSVPDTNHVYGLTIDNIAGLKNIDTALARLCKKPTTRIVFDEFVAATYYQTAVNQIHNYSFIMGELLDSYYMNQYNLTQYQNRANEYLNLLGPKVDIWEIGNEVNGEWCGTISDVVAKINTAYTIFKGQNKKTALTLYYNKVCYSNASNEMFRWVNANLSSTLRNGLDYVWVSYYEDDCNNYQPNWQQVFDSLHVLFPNSKLGIGECGTVTANNKAPFISRYYKMNITTPNYVGGYFWWYFYEDCIPYTNSLWTTFNNAISNYSPPTVQASQITYSAQTSNSVTLAWTNGNGGNRIVFMRDADGVLPVIQDGVTYTANTNFGLGTSDGTGWYCVYNGSAAMSGNITITGLLQNHDYKVMTLEYNGTPGFEGYNKTTSANNPILIIGFLPVEIVSFVSNIEKNNVRLQWITNSEINNKEFQIQKLEIRSQNSEWENIGIVNGKGTINTITTYNFEERNLQPGIYKYRLKQIDINGNFVYHYLSTEVNISTPEKFEVKQNYPNPFNPSTVIGYSLSDNEFVTLKVYDILGKEIATLVNEFKKAGTYETKFPDNKYTINQLPSGTYFYSLQTKNFKQTKSMLIIK